MTLIDSVPQTLELALQHHQAGHLQQAQALYQQILQIQPSHSDALHLSGLIAHQYQDDETAMKLIREALRYRSDVVLYYLNLGLILLEHNHLEEAVSVSQQALTLEPNNAQAYFNLGNALYAQKKLDEALLCYRRAISLEPNMPKFYNNLGNLLSEQQKWDEAITHYQQALRLQPNFVEAYNNLGVALKEQKQYLDAVAYFKQALQLNPNFINAYSNLGIVLKELDQLEEAVVFLKRAIALGSTETKTYQVLADILNEQCAYSEAAQCYQQALTLKSFASAEAYNNLGMTLVSLGRIEEAVTYFEQAIALNPPFIAVAYSNLLYTLHYSPSYERQTIFQKHQAFNKRLAAPLLTTVPFPNDKHLQRKLKIAYVSADFYKHSVAYFIEPILAHHDRHRFEIYCYYNNFMHDEVTQRLQTYVDHFLPRCHELTDEALAWKIREDEIDILIDLTGHFGRNRLLVFAQKPAPIQVTYLGYPDTTGLTSIDYRIVDHYVEPQGAIFSSETLVRMFYSYFCYRPHENSPAISEQPVLKNGYVTFGSFNNYAKLSSPILELWAQILHTVPHSRLLIKSKSLQDPHLCQIIQEKFMNLGISSSRLMLSPYLKATASHLETYSQVDIALDSYPYNGATTTCETLWMGVPVITLVGKTHVSRMGLSLLTTIGIRELIAQTSKEYLNIAVKLAHDTSYLQDFRRMIRMKMQVSPLMQAASFTWELEKHYLMMWEKWCQQEISEYNLSQTIDLAKQYFQNGQFSQAEQLCQHVLEREAHHVEALHVLGLIAYENKNYLRGIQFLRQAIHSSGQGIHYLYTNLGMMLSQQHQFTEAIACYQHALLLNSEDAVAYNNLGTEFLHQGHVQQAVAHFRKAVEIKSKFWAHAHSNLLYTLHYMTEGEMVFLEHQRFNEYHAMPLNKLIQSHTNDRDLEKKLKVAYVSADFRKHSVAYFLEPILAHHHRDQFEIFCYALNPHQDNITQCLQQHVDHWIDSASFSDEALVEKIRQDGIDILVDLMGHTGLNRILIFARKPAPVQVTYLGYPDTTGLSSIDYRITDGYVDPVGIADRFSSEALVRMPQSYFCYRPAEEAKAIPWQASPVLKNGFITLGSLNNYAKISPSLLVLWAKILQALPQAKLLIKNQHVEDSLIQQQLRTKLAQLGVHADRILFFPFVSSWTSHLETYHRIDIALDTYPYNGATTTCEALWMGVPVVTLVGKTHASRMGLSLLSTLGLKELVAYTPKDYVDLCVKLANQPESLQSLRSSLRAKMQASPLMDAHSFTHHLEIRYREMWNKWCESFFPQKVTLNIEEALQLGHQSLELGQLEKAEYLYRQILQTEPQHAMAWYSLGLVAYRVGKLQQAEECIKTALQSNSIYAPFYTHLGIILADQKRVHEAMEAYRRALHFNPEDAIAHNNLASHLLNRGQVNEAIAHFKKALHIDPTYHKAHSNLLFALNYSEVESAQIFPEYQAFNEQHVRPFIPFILPHANVRDVYKPLRIAYLSQDFGKHSVVYFIEPILKNHDRHRFEVYCYHTNSVVDNITHRLRRYASQFIEAWSLSDEALSEQIRQDGIDILVDLAGHMGRHRVLVFARKPAPIQVAYLGYSNTTGLSTMDYRITDHYTDPQGHSEKFNSEQLVRMPKSHFCFVPEDETLHTQITPLPALRPGEVTFGSLNKLPKLSPTILKLWAHVLDALPHSKLVIKARGLEEETVEKEIRNSLTKYGIDNYRVTCVGYHASMENYLELYRHIDIVLDTFPYHGATTTCEALWMGVPVVTWVGEKHLSRMGLSILSTAGLTELIAYTPQEYVAICIRLANDIKYLQHLRETLRSQMGASSLMDAQAFTRDLEKLYRDMWEKWCVLN